MIEIKNLYKKFGSKVLFDNLNINIETSKMTFMYGESGCGKTTLINMIGLIEKYDQGEIIYDGYIPKSNKDIRIMRRDKIGFIFQDFGLIENETVKDNFNLLYKRKLDKKNDGKIMDCLNILGLKDYIDRPIHELSGGEQQRVAIAKIIYKDPDIILADEPTASLDDDNKRVVLNYLKQLSQKGKTVIIVTHDKSILDYGDNHLDLDLIKKNNI